MERFRGANVSLVESQQFAADRVDTFVSKPQRQVETGGGIDQPEMAKGLRKVPQRFARFGVDFLTQESQVVRGIGVSLEDFEGGVESSADGQGFGQPKAAKDERAFVACKTIRMSVPIEIAAVAELFLNPLYGS